MKKIIYIMVVVSALTGLWFTHIHPGWKIAISVVAIFFTYIIYKIDTSKNLDESMTDEHWHGEDIEKKKDS